MDPGLIAASLRNGRDAGVLLQCSGIGKALSARPIVFVGLISYSLYLWHWPLLVFAQYISIGKPDWRLRVALLVLSAILATLSWKFVETPFRKRLLCPRRPQLFAFASLAARKVGDITKQVIRHLLVVIYNSFFADPVEGGHTGSNLGRRVVERSGGRVVKMTGRRDVCYW